MSNKNKAITHDDLESLFKFFDDFNDKKPKKISEGNEVLVERLKNQSFKSKNSASVLLESDGFKYRKPKKLSDTKKNRELNFKCNFITKEDESIEQKRIDEVFEPETTNNFVGSRIVNVKEIREITSNVQDIPSIKARVIKSEKNEEVIIKDRSLRIARDFINREKIILVGEEKYLYNGKFYARLRERELQTMLFERYYSEIGQGNALAIISNAAKLVEFCIKKKLEEFPINDNFIVFENGTLEIGTGRFRINSPVDMASSALGIKYHPNRWEMPHTQKFLETIAEGDDDLYELMLQVIGYILSNDIKAKSFFYLEGVGDAGKSRFCDLVASFFPISGTNKVARTALQDLDGKFALANLVNAKLNISEDLPDKPLSVATVSKIKMLSDGNRQEAEAKYVQKFSFRPTCKLLFASNHPLRLKEYDQAFVNRVVYIPFLKAVPKHKQDRNILEKMQRELPELFNHAFAAYRRLVTNGYCWSGSEKYKPRIEIVNSGIVFNKQNELKEFVEKCCDFQDDCKTKVSDLQEVYYEFCQKHNYIPILGDRFSRELMAVLPDSVSRTKIGNQCRGFKGIRVVKSYPMGDFQAFN